MPTFQKCPPEITEAANAVMCQYTEHKLLLDAKVKIDFLFAFADVDATGARRGFAIKHHGIRALGYARRIGLKDRVKGQGDCEIVLDGDWWGEHDADQCRALLDHELHHLEVVTDKYNRIQWDDIMRPKLRLRPHDFEFGWFAVIAQRHGAASQECIQAKTILDSAGQFFWPDLCGEPPLANADEPTIEMSSGGKTTGPLPLSKFEAAAKAIQKKTYRLKKP